MTTGPYGPLLDAVRGVRWPAGRRVAGATLGAHPSRLRGQSSEFSEFRPYRQGDDPRRVDWRLLARSDRTYIRLTTDRATLRTMLVVDASASMAFPTPALDKWRLAREVAVGLAAVAHGEGDPVGLAIVHGERPVTLPPRARRSVLGEMMRALDATRPTGAAPLAGAVREARAERVVVIGDLLGDLDRVLAEARLRLAGNGEMSFVHVVATEELDPPPLVVLAVDPEAPDRRHLLDVAGHTAYRRAFNTWLGAVAERVREAGIRYVRAETGEAPSSVVRRVVAGVARVGGR